MRMPKTLGLSLALLVASSVAMAKQNPSSDHHTGVSSKAKSAPQAKARSANKAVATRRTSTKRKNVVHRARDTVRRTRLAAGPR